MSEYFIYFLEILSHLFYLVLILFYAGGAGYVFIRKQHFHSTIEKLAFSIGLGFGVCGLFFFGLGLLGLLFQKLILILTVLGAAAVIIQLLRSHFFAFT